VEKLLNYSFGANVPLTQTIPVDDD